MWRLPAALVFVVVLGGCPGDIAPPTCPCTPCTAAVELTVTDAVNGGPIENFEIETLINGEPVGTPDGCQPEQRNGNFCAFGFETGIYDIVVSAPAFATRETRVRQPERGSGELCCRACLSARVVALQLDPL